MDSRRKAETYASSVAVWSNFLLMLRIIEMTGKGYGMPSSHSQFVAFFAVSLSLFLLFRHVPSTSTSYSPTTFVERVFLSLCACLGAGAVASSRVYLNYHTPKQVWVGVGAGVIFAIIWFSFVAYLRQYGWVEWTLDSWIAKALRLRDLIITEDIQDAGWVRWEEMRKVKRNSTSRGRSKKAR
jgi:dolichyldiphosphatase